MRYHLDSIETTTGTIWLTLVCENPFRFFVEQYNDSKLSFLKDRLKVIQAGDLDRHGVNGISLATLVERKRRQIQDMEKSTPASVAAAQK